MPSWNSSQYLKFNKERTQPAIDLASRVNNNPLSILDIGCGPGNSTQVLKNFFPNAHIVGIDNSENMIERARKDHGDISFQLCDVYSIKGKYDLLFSNACLQWVENHEVLIPFLLSHLNDNGLLAVQVPMNGEEPLFKLINDVALDSKWGLKGVKLQPNETLSPLEYYKILSSHSSSFSIWESKYYHTMDNHRALVEWVKGTRLRPYLDALSPEEGREFEEEIVEKSKELYPVMENGKVVLGFRRLFFTATVSYSK